MTFTAAKSKVLNRGVPPDSFLTELVLWGRSAPDEIFAPNDRVDIYNKVRHELGPWTSPLHRRAVMLEVMRVLAGFESSWKWTEGVDTSKDVANNDENAEAGAWQVSYDARKFDVSLRTLLTTNGVTSGRSFQAKMKSNHALAMEFVSRLMRFTTKHNGPLYKDDERSSIRPSLRDPVHSIYPWLRREAVNEFVSLLS